MNIRKKILWNIIGLTVGLIVIFSAATYYVLQKKFDQLERKTVVDNLDRVEATLNDQIQALDTLTHDWANWDDTWSFVVDGNADYIASNIVVDTFSTSARIELLLIFNSSAEPVHAVYYDKQKDRMEDPLPTLLDMFTEEDGLLDQVTSQNTEKKGLIRFGNQYFFLAVRPILRSNGEGPCRGSLVMGRLLDRERIDKLREITGMSVRFLSLDRPLLSSREQQAVTALYRDGTGQYISARSEQCICGYRLVRDIFDVPVLLLALDQDRDIHLQGHSTINFLLFSLVIIAGIFGVAIFFLIDTLVIARLTSLTQDIVRIEQNTSRTGRVKEYSTGDELGKLSYSLNKMLDAIETLEKYKIRNEKLEVLATFAAGAAHEFATPLSTIAIASGEILHDLEKKEIVSGQLREDVILIREQVKRCKDILFQMAADAGEHMGEEIKEVSVGELIAGVLERMDPSVIKRVEVKTTIGEKHIAVPVRSLRRVLRGLIKNSIAASTADDPVIFSCYEENSFLFFKVRDYGIGMDEYTLQHAADPFFTTRSPGNGMGLGLYLAQSLANRLGGTLRLFSQPGEGSTVIISFAGNRVFSGELHD